MIDWRLVLGRLRPKSEYHWRGNGLDDTYASVGEWRDPNTTKPPEQECLDEWEVYLVEKAAEDADEAQIEQKETDGRTGWKDLGNWSTWEPQQAPDYVNAEILNGFDQAQIDAYIDENITGTTIATLRVQVIVALKLLAGNIITMRNILSIIAKVILYIRDILIKKL